MELEKILFIEEVAWTRKTNISCPLSSVVFSFKISDVSIKPEVSTENKKLKVIHGGGRDRVGNCRLYMI